LWLETVAGGAIREFAQKFEQVFISTKLATGLARASDAESDSRNRLWVVRIGSAITYKVDPKNQHFFASIPLGDC
jgi:streptogramin lyase